MTHWELARAACRLGAVQKVGELAQLIRFLGRSPLRTVVEVGSFTGGTFWAWSRVAADDALLVSVDLPGRDAPGVRGRADQRVKRLLGDSHDPEVVGRVLELTGGRADWVFIDGDHSYDGARQDWLNFGPMGGLVGFHDIVSHPLDPDSEVDRLWTEIRKTHRTREFVDGGGGFGIGVVEGLLPA